MFTYTNTDFPTSYFQMRHSKTILIFLLILLLPDLSGQESGPETVREQFEQFDQLFGLDQNLINGIRYRIEFPDTKGHPFLDEENFMPGSVQIGDSLYKNVHLAYNIYNQEVVLKYKNTFGGSEYIILHNEFIDGFSLGSRKFQKLDSLIKGQPFFQVIDAGRLKCYYSWTKGINESGYPYSFWEPNRKLYLFKDDLIHPFKSKAAFTRLFVQDYRKSIKKHMKKPGFRLKYISDSEMMELLQYCIQLSEQ